ncbi:MAG: VanZ family protein [Pseudomonadota bacterium]
MRKLNLQFLAVVLFWACIFASAFVMLMELAPKTGGWPYWDKVQHIFGFGIFTVLGCFAYRQKKGYICLGLSIYGALIEYLQSTLTVTRMASFADWLADIFGIVIAVVICVLIKNLSTKNTVVLSSNTI